MTPEQEARRGELRECPFCGDGAIEVCQFPDDDCSWWAVSCAACGSKGPDVKHDNSGGCPSTAVYQEAARLWNSRAHAAPVSQDAEEAAKVLLWKIIKRVDRQDGINIIAAAIRKAVEGERRACAHIADQYGDSDWNEDIHNEPPPCATAIEAVCRKVGRAIRARAPFWSQSRTCRRMENGNERPLA